MTTNISDELLNLFESLLRAQLNTVRQLRKAAGLKQEQPSREGRMSHINMVYDILLKAQRPMHVDEIITAVHSQFNQKLDKESVVSALLKRVKRHDRFVKSGPNMFYLLSHHSPGERS